MVRRSNGALPSWWKALRREAFTSFEAQGFPTRKNEEWKYTNVKSIADGRYRLAAATPATDMAGYDAYRGRGDIDLVGYIRVLHENGYTGPLDLEIIGAKDYTVEQCCTIAAESRGHMQASLQACAAR